MHLPTHNPRLNFVKSDWEGNPMSVDRRSYVNLDGASEKSLKDVLKWQLGPKPLKSLKKSQKSSLVVVKDGYFLDKSKDGFTWLGHTTFMFDVAGLRLISDPVLYDISVIKRFTELPCKVEALTGIDVIMLSHNHRDHMDERSLKLLCSLNPSAVILTGLQTSKTLKKWKIKNEIIEAGWYQSYGLGGDIDICYLPSKHWTRRYLHDTNVALWGSFMISHKAEDTHIYFGADSGYGQHFGEISNLFPSIRAALLGIGAYEPYWFMHPSHTGPVDALKAFKDLNAQTFVPMHYGTFDLSDEPVYYPEKILKEIIAEQSVDFIKFMKIGAKSPF